MWYQSDGVWTDMYTKRQSYLQLSDDLLHELNKKNYTEYCGFKRWKY